MSRFEQYKHLEIESQRLKLCILNENHVQSVLDYYLLNRDFFAQWNPIPRPEFWTPSFQKQKLLSDQILLIEKRQVKFWIYETHAPQKIIGHVNFSNIVWGGFLSCFLGYNIGEMHNGKGYATEAVDKAAEFMFSKAKLHRIEANIMPHNAGSIRVAEKAGFTYEGTSPKYLKINGIWEDHLHYVKRNAALE